VNFASRLEGANKAYLSRILISGGEYAQVVQYASTRCHPAGRDHDLGQAVGVNGLRILNCLSLSDSLGEGVALGIGQAMFASVTIEHLASLDRHRAVEKDRKIGNATGSLQSNQMVKQSLCPADGEGGNNDRSSPACRAIDDGGQNVRRIADGMRPVPVGGFDDDIIRVAHRLRC
jgi:hypothetical protein